MAMMTGRVLLVCALCVLWCGTPGGRCQEGVDPSGFSPAGPTGDATGNDLLVEEAEGPRREEVGKPKDELGEGTVLNSGITTVEVSETATPDKKTVPAPGPKQEPPPPEKEKVVPTGPSSSGTEPASSKPVPQQEKAKGYCPLTKYGGGKKEFRCRCAKGRNDRAIRMASETSNKNGVETRQSQPMVTVSGDGNKQI
ncbi:hypothetical protein TcBrA4_0111510 [Trypanosoma cruzi]|nr:hypothetical protein TcBrA4_0111510 [Trypanosoma cruzi]